MGMKKCGEKSVTVSDIDALEITGEGDIQVQLMGEKNTSTIKIEVWTRGTQTVDVPRITQKGRRASLTIPAATAPSHKLPLYRISLPRDMDAFLSGKKVTLTTQDMSEESFIDVKTQEGFSVSYHPKRLSAKKGTSLPNSFSSQHTSGHPLSISFLGDGSKNQESFSCNALSDKMMYYNSCLGKYYEIFLKHTPENRVALEAEATRCSHDLKKIATHYVRDMKAAFPFLENIRNKIEVTPHDRQKRVCDDCERTLSQVDSIEEEKIRDEIMLNKQNRSLFFRLRKNLEKDMKNAFHTYEDKIYSLTNSAGKAALKKARVDSCEICDPTL